MKKSLQLLLSLSYALSFTACAADDSDDDTGANTDVTAATEASATMTTAPSTTVADDTAGETPADDTAGETPADDTAADDTAADDTGTGEMACVHTCAADADCTVAGGTDAGYVCTDTQCVPANPCADDSVCIAQFSGWSFTPCTMGGGECSAAMQVCVDLGDGTGGCAYPAEGGAVDCATLTFDEVDATNLDDGTAVTVCGNGSAYCNMDGEFNFCSSRCADDTECGDLTCNTGSGVCECSTDDQCTALEGGTCVDTACHYPGCATDDDCTNPFDGGTIACQ